MVKEAPGDVEGDPLAWVGRHRWGGGSGEEAETRDHLLSHSQIILGANIAALVGNGKRFS